MKKCLVVKPKESMEAVKNLLNSKKISYSFHDDDIIFANIDEGFLDLEEQMGFSNTRR